MTLEEAIEKLEKWPVKIAVIGFYMKDGEVKFDSVLTCDDEQRDKARKNFINYVEYELKKINQ